MKTPFAVLKIQGLSFRDLNLWQAVDWIEFNEGEEKMDMLTVKMSGIEGLIFDKNLFEHGADVEFAIGYQSEFETLYEFLFEGLIKTLEPTWDDVPNFVLEAFDYSLLMDKKIDKAYQNMKVSAIITDIAGKYPKIKNLDIDTADIKPPTDEQLFDQEITDREFVQKLALLCGYRFWVSKDTLHFKNYNKVADFPSGSTLMFGHPSREGNWIILKGFAPRTDIEGIATTIRIISERPLSIENISADAREIELVLGKKSSIRIVYEIFGERVKTIRNRLPKDVDEAQKMTKAELTRESMEFLQGSGELEEGNPYIRAGQIRHIVLNGLPDIDGIFSGEYIITATTHRLSDQGYGTVFECKRNALDYE